MVYDCGMGFESFNAEETGARDGGAEQGIEGLVAEKAADAFGAADELFALLRAEEPDPAAIKAKHREASWKAAGAHSYMISQSAQDFPEYSALRELNARMNRETEDAFSGMFEREMGAAEPAGEASPEAVGEAANYEADVTGLLIERLRDERISGQLAKLVYLDRKYDIAFEDEMTLEEAMRHEAELIAAVANDTPVTFDGAMPSGSKLDGVRENIDVNYRCGGTFGEYGVRQKNIAEAHEKGHTVRKLRSGAAQAYFGKALDLSSISIPEERMALYAEEIRTMEPDMPMPTKDEMAESIREYLRDPMEVAERMSQLKNYFGIPDGKPFTKEHLRYARDHYIADTKMDNNMFEFFQAVTPETEDAFIRIINSAGI